MANLFSQCKKTVIETFETEKRGIVIALPLKETVMLLICAGGMFRTARVSGSNGPGKESDVSILPNRNRHHN